MNKAILYTAFALLAFALNSILCRLALRSGEADASGFTLVRIVSGAVTLSVLSFLFARNKTNGKRGNWLSAFFLFAYAICFSFAYLALTAATGALLLFGAVQFTMIGVAMIRGERPKPIEWLGLATALGGLVYLVLPGLSSPPVLGSVLMLSAGIAWGAYSLRGKASRDPLADTTGNFVRAAPFAAAGALAAFPVFHLTVKGMLLAILSGAIASGLGYAVWYAALEFHTPTRAAVLQLLVPVIAAFLAVLILSEAADMRLALAGALVIGGIGLTILARQPQKR